MLNCSAKFFVQKRERKLNYSIHCPGVLHFSHCYVKKKKIIDAVYNSIYFVARAVMRKCHYSESPLKNYHLEARARGVTWWVCVSRARLCNLRNTKLPLYSGRLAKGLTAKFRQSLLARDDNDGAMQMDGTPFSRVRCAYVCVCVCVHTCVANACGGTSGISGKWSGFAEEKKEADAKP